MFTRILVPLDGSRLAEQAIPTAVSLARAAHACIDVLTVDDGRADRRYVESIATEITTGASVPATCAVVEGSPAEGICAWTRDISADLIVMTSHGRTGLSRLWLGSVADHVVRAATIPVLVLPAASESPARRDVAGPFAHVLVLYDGSALSADALPLAVDLGRLSKAHITLLHVAPVVPAPMPIDPTVGGVIYPVIPDEEATVRLAADMRRDLQAVAERLARESGLDVEAVVEVSEHTSDCIVTFAHTHHADVIVMSTHGRGASRWLLGSVTDKVLRASRLPMLLRRPAAVAQSTAVEQSGVERQLASVSGD